MRLTHISATNFKGRSFQYVLPPKLAIVGNNFVGKSAVIDAIRWLLMGYVPEVGKLNSALWEYSSGDFMNVSGMVVASTKAVSTLKFDFNRTITRRMELVRGTIKATGPVSEEGELPLIPGLNAEHYFSLSDRERVNYVFNAVPMPKEFSPETLLVEWDNINIDGIDAEELAFAKKQLLPFAAKLLKEPIDAVLADIREQYTYWNRREKDTIGAVRTLTELKLREHEASSQTLAELQKEIAANETAATELNSKIVRYESEVAASNAIERERAGYERIINAKTNQADEIKRLQKLIEEAEAKRKPMLSDDEFKEIGRKMRALDKKRDEALGNFSAASQKDDSLTQQLDELKGLKVCPYCKSSKAGWKKNIETALGMAREIVKGTRASSTLVLEQVDKDLAELRRQVTVEENARANNLAMDSGIRSWEREIAQLVRSEIAFAEERERAKKALEALPPTTTPEGEPNVWVTERDDLRNKTAAMRTRYNELVRLQQDLKRAAESSQEHNRAVAMVKVLKKAAEILQERKKAMVEIVFSKLLSTANSIFGAILKSPLSLFDNTIGRWAGAKFIPHRVFSGTEKALCYTAISAALSAQSPMKLAIIDEFQRLDKKNQVKALGMLSAAVDKGTLEQFIVVGTEIAAAQGTVVAEEVTLLTIP